MPFKTDRARVKPLQFHLTLQNLAQPLQVNLTDFPVKRLLHLESISQLPIVFGGGPCRFSGDSSGARITTSAKRSSFCDAVRKF